VRIRRKVDASMKVNVPEDRKRVAGYTVFMIGLGAWVS
jgi:hypothetical protein